MRGAPEAFGAAVVDLFSCALIVMLVLWLTTMGTGPSMRKPVSAAFTLSVVHPHADKLTISIGGKEVSSAQCVAEPIEGRSKRESGTLYQCPGDATGRSSFGTTMISASEWETPITVEMKASYLCQLESHHIDIRLVQPNGVEEAWQSGSLKGMKARNLTVEYVPGRAIRTVLVEP